MCPSSKDDTLHGSVTGIEKHAVHVGLTIRSLASLSHASKDGYRSSCDTLTRKGLVLTSRTAIGKETRVNSLSAR